MWYVHTHTHTKEEFVHVRTPSCIYVCTPSVEIYESFAYIRNQNGRCCRCCCCCCCCCCCGGCGFYCCCCCCLHNKNYSRGLPFQYLLLSQPLRTNPTLDRAKFRGHRQHTLKICTEINGVCMWYSVVVLIVVIVVFTLSIQHMI